MPVDAADLATLPLLRGLDSREVEEVGALLEVANLPAGSEVIREGDAPGTPLFILLKGSVDVIKRGADGRGHLISSLGAPSVFGEIEVLVHRRAIATVNAMTDVTIASLKRGVFDEMCAKNRPWALKLVRNLAQVLGFRLAATDERLAAQFNLLSPDNRRAVGELRQVMLTTWPE